MNVRPHTRNVTRIFREASPEELATGRDWYARASRLADELAHSLPADHPHYGDISRAAAVIAVLSPMLSWALNVRYARLAYELAVAPWGWSVMYLAEGIPVLKRNAWKAGLLLNTDAPTDEIVKGPKVTAFWRTIADPTDPRAVVVDRHAIDVSLGRVTDDTTRGRVLGRKGAYGEVSQAYTRAARILSAELVAGGHLPITPAEVQAVTWTVWRNHYAAANHGDAAAEYRAAGHLPAVA